eukprot:gene24718-29869_t
MWQTNISKVLLRTSRKSYQHRHRQALFSLLNSRGGGRIDAVPRFLEVPQSLVVDITASVSAFEVSANRKKAVAASEMSKFLALFNGNLEDDGT